MVLLAPPTGFLDPIQIPVVNHHGRVCALGILQCLKVFLCSICIWV